MHEAILPAVPSDSLTLVRGAYSVSLVSLLPLAAAVVCAVLLRKRSAGERVLVWRSAVVVLVVACVSQLAPFQWRAWIIPQDLASPLVTLGRAQLALFESVSPWSGGGSVITLFAGIYLLVAVCVATPTILSLARLRRARLLAAPLRVPHCLLLIDEVRRSTGMRRAVDIRVSPQIDVPVTWGVLSPVVLLPPSAIKWPRELLRAALIHEFNHVQRADALFVLLARMVCAIQWFNPGAWWVSARLRRDTELACDDRVLAAGVRRSDYAELLSRASFLRASGMGAAGAAPVLSLAGGLRERLACATDRARKVTLPCRAARLASVAATLALSAAISLVELAPTREVLSTLMSDDRWDTRAYAVMRLAQRPDTIQVAREAAAHDPSPRVRAWARYALARLEPSTLLSTPSARN